MKFILTTAFLCWGALLKAQTFTFGPKVGVNFSSINFDRQASFLDTGFRLVTQDAKFGLVGGLFIRLKFKNIYFQPEALFAQERTSFKLTSNFDEIGEIKEVQFNKLDIPINIGIKMGKALRIQGGIVASYVYGPQINQSTQNFKYLTKFSTAETQWSYKLGLGLDIRRRATVDISYEGNMGLNNASLNLAGNPIVLSSRKNNIQFTLGIALIPFKK
jgi:hypothetical protein